MPDNKSVRGELKFLAGVGKPLVYLPSKGGGDATDHHGDFTSRVVTIHDGRALKSSASLDIEGFRLVSQTTAVEDFYDDVEIRSTYHREVEALLMEIMGAARVEIFDDTRRTSSLGKQRLKKIREPAAIVHNDYTATSGIKRLRDHFAENPLVAETLLLRRFAIINVWRSIAGPVYSHPLVVCDATTVNSDDLYSMERRAEERIGQLQVARYDPGQRWYYFPDMQMDEALLLKTFDSATDGRTRFTLHSSVDDQNMHADAPPRESIETRCFVFF